MVQHFSLHIDLFLVSEDLLQVEILARGIVVSVMHVCMIRSRVNTCLKLSLNFREYLLGDSRFEFWISSNIRNQAMMEIQAISTRVKRWSQPAAKCSIHHFGI